MHGIVTGLALAALLLIGSSSERARPVADLGDEQVSMLGYGDREKTCVEWTDSCLTCRRGENGEPQCPNIGIACQPKAIVCLKRSEPAKQ